ncbi:MAG: hypothetical protein WCR52_01055 [Bacteroidota bacterium]
MYVYSNFNSGRGGTGCLIFGILGLVASYFILKGLFVFLSWAAPVLFILSLIINWRAVADTGKDFLALLERNPLAGLLTAALCVVGFPVLALYLFIKALGYNKLKSFKQQFNGQRPNPSVPDFVEFEVLESRPKSMPRTETPEEEPLEPPVIPEKARDIPVEKPHNPYDQMF